MEETQGTWLGYKKINLAENFIDDEGVVFLHRFPNLRLLDISFNKITKEGIQVLGEGEFPNLHELYLRKKCDISGGIKMRN